MNILVTCQGAIQLVSAICTIRRRYKSFDDLNYFLFVYDLGLDTDGCTKFFDIIKFIAKHFLNWKEIVYLDDDCMRAILLSGAKGKVVEECLAQEIGFNGFDEVLVSSNCHGGNLAITNALRSSKIICFGDGLSVYLPYGYQYLTRKEPLIKNLLGRNSYCKSFLSLAKNGALKCNFFQGHLYQVPINAGYFLFPDLYGQLPKFKYELIEKQDFIDVFAEISQLIPLCELDFISSFENGDGICVLLTSCFSEASRVSLEDEIYAYDEFLRFNNGENRNALLIKPHPRDSKEKISKLRNYFSARFDHVYVLDSDIQKFMPFESMLMRAIQTGLINSIGQLELYCFSSVFLSFKFLLGLKTHLGFGEKIVKRHFYRIEVGPRLAHEKDLNFTDERICDGLSN